MPRRDTPKPLDAWSWSRLSLYELCPFKFKEVTLHDNGEPANAAMQRGRAIHDMAKDFLLGKLDAVPEALKSRSDVLQHLKTFKDKYIEQQWALNRKWKVAPYFSRKGNPNTPWFRYSLDAGADYGDNTFEAVDWKTGKKYGYSDDQMEVFALGVMCRFPHLEEVTTRLSYVDMEPGPDSEVIAVFKASDKEKLTDKWEKRVEPLFNDDIFAPRQNDKCHWCHLARSTGGPCKFG